MSIVYLNGNFIPLEDAKVSVLDRGFTFGDGIYEVMPVFSGKVFRLNEHLHRLNTNLSEIALEPDYSPEKWASLMDELLERNSMNENCSIYIQITRGVGDRNHLYGPNFIPTVFIMCKPVPSTNFSLGVSAVIHEDIRWKYCHIKAITLLASVMLKQYAREKNGAYEAILTKDGYVIEGAASNVFIVKDKIIKTPPKDGKLLPGITRDLLVELIRTSDYDCKEIKISEPELLDADEIWITSATMGIAPVIKINDKPVGEGGPGQVWRNVDAIYQKFKISAV